MKRNLVICRAGDRSLHRGWLGDPATRSYDVWLDCWGDDPARWAGDPARVSVGLGTTKWPRAAALLAERPEGFRYDAVWFPDDDLAVDPAGVERLFALFHRLGLALAQPALAPGSYFSFEWSLAHRGFTARYTNCAEVMAPLFSRAALAACAPSFGESVSGWGLDTIWPRLLGDPRDGIAVLDAAPVLHTRPIGGAGWYRSLPEPPLEEKHALQRRYGVPVPYVYRQYGGIPASAAPERNAALPAGLGFAARLARGAPEAVRWSRRYWSRTLRAVRDGRP